MRTRALRRLSPTDLDELHPTVIVAVARVGVVQMPADEVVHMVSMRNRLVPTAWAMSVLALMFPARVIRRAARRIRAAHGDGMVIDMLAVHVVQVTIVQIIGVTFVPHSSMPTSSTVLVLPVILVLGTVHRASSIHSTSAARNPEPAGSVDEYAPRPAARPLDAPLPAVARRKPSGVRT
jgi:hypothetical protein